MKQTNFPEESSFLLFQHLVHGCPIYLMKYVNKSLFSTRVSSPAAHSAFCVDFAAIQIRLELYMVVIYLVRRL